MKAEAATCSGESQEGSASGAHVFPLHLSSLVNQLNSDVEGVANGQSPEAQFSRGGTFPLQLASLVSEPNSVLRGVADKPRQGKIKL